MNAPYQLFKNLDGATEGALRASISRFGVLVPVAKDQHGNVLDGHQRARIADGLGLKYPVNIIEVADEDEAREIARTLNEERRAMPKEERLPVAVALAEEGHSNVAIAGALGVSEATVRRDLAGSSYDEPDRVRGLDGKSYPARKRLKYEPAPRTFEEIDRDIKEGLAEWERGIDEFVSFDPAWVAGAPKRTLAKVNKWLAYNINYGTDTIVVKCMKFKREVAAAKKTLAEEARAKKQPVAP